MRLSRLFIGALSLILVSLASPGVAQTPSPFENWTVAIVAGDWRTAHGQPIEAFDNAVRDLSAAFERAGFSGASMVAATLRPDVDVPVTTEQVLSRISETAARAPEGCLIYLTSHGSPRGAVFGPSELMTPARLAELVNGWCGTRPTVVVVSACYSGVFTPVLARPNRIVLTAARRDRSSFGCSEEATYPYFDGCVLQTLPTATDFIDLAQSTRACVALREKSEGLSPPSEPQLVIGAEMQLRGPTLRFIHPSG